MDKLDKYRKIIVSVVKKHAQYQPSHGQIEAEMLNSVIKLYILK